MITASSENPSPGDHPENASSRTWFCSHDRHGDCRGAVADPKKRSNWKCECTCHDRARTKRHDWLDQRFDDEIDLEHAVAHAPPLALSAVASLNGVVPGDATDVGHWLSLGRFKVTARRPANTDSRWTLSCRRCPKGKAQRVRTELFCVDADERVIDWLQGDKHPVHVSTVAEPARLYRVGRCIECQTMFWFELVEAGKDRK